MRNRDFITGKVPITKEEVRAISINKLDLLNAKTFIDRKSVVRERVSERV